MKHASKIGSQLRYPTVNLPPRFFISFSMYMWAVIMHSGSSWALVKMSSMNAFTCSYVGFDVAVLLLDSNTWYLGIHRPGLSAIKLCNTALALSMIESVSTRLVSVWSMNRLLVELERFIL